MRCLVCASTSIETILSVLMSSNHFCVEVYLDFAVH